MQEPFLTWFSPSRQQASIEFDKVWLEGFEQTKASVSGSKIIKSDAGSSIPNGMGYRAKLIDFGKLFGLHKLQHNLRGCQAGLLRLGPESGKITLGISYRAWYDIDKKQLAFVHLSTSDFYRSEPGDLIKGAHFVEATSSMNKLGTTDQATLVLGASEGFKP